MRQYSSKDLKSNSRRAAIYYAGLAGIAILVLGLLALALTALYLPESAEGSRQAQLEPERQYEVGDVARFVVAGGLVHQGPIADYRLDSNNRWVYDVEFPADDGSISSIWENLEEFRILLVDEDSAPYQPRVEGYPVKLVDPMTGETVDGDVTEGIVTGGREIGGIWNYHLLVLGCKEILPPEGLTIVLIDSLEEPFTCEEEDARKDDRQDREREEPTATPTPTATPEPTPEPEAVHGDAGPDQTVSGTLPIKVTLDARGSTGIVGGVEWWSGFPEFYQFCETEDCPLVLTVDPGFTADSQPGDQRTFVLLAFGETSVGGYNITDIDGDTVTITLGEIEEAPDSDEPEEEPDATEGATGSVTVEP